MHPVLLALLAACTSPQMRVRTALVDAGLRAPVADCMAEQMTDQLSLSQLQKLGRAAGASEGFVPGREAAELVALAQRVDDPEVIGIVAAAGLVCSLIR